VVTPQLFAARRFKVDLTRFPSRRYTEGATPIEPLPRFSAALAAACPGGRGPEVWIKRDDLLGLSPGGNKTRKLEFLVADALAQGCDTLVTCGAPQSNHCRITLAAAVKEGLQCRFVIEERIPNSFDAAGGGNHFLFRLMGVEAITVVPAGTAMAAAMQKVADELAALGRKAYVIAGGGSNALGGLGYVACAQELQQQLFERGLALDHLVVGSGSSGTHGGLVGNGGSTHYAVEDLSLMCSLTNMTVTSIGDPLMVGDILRQSMKMAGPIYIRLGVGKSDQAIYEPGTHDIKIGKGIVARDGS
jgi:D-cysteine desulfhydrase